MFTGIVTHCSPIVSAQHDGGILRLVLEVEPGFTEGLVRGASVAVDGICLTAVKWTKERVHFDCIDETLRRTRLGSLGVGQKVNLERAARFGDEIGGHPLSGHIHCTGQVNHIEREEENVAMAISVPAQWAPYVIEKGYIAINGCSLTVGHVDGQTFNLHLIPETLHVTNLSTLAPGDDVNVEIDHQTLVIVNTVERVLAQRQINKPGS